MVTAITKIIPQVQKVYIDKNNEGTVTCPDCRKGKRAKFASYKGVREILKVKCGCGCAFGIIIDQRKYYRKKTKFNGNYTVLESSESGSMIVEDLSFTGIGFRPRQSHNIHLRDAVELRFILDNRLKSEMCKKAIVRRIRGQFIGAEFCDDKAYDTALGYYLMPS